MPDKMSIASMRISIDSLQVVSFRHCGITFCKWSRKNSFCSVTKCFMMFNAANNDFGAFSVRHFSKTGPIWNGNTNRFNRDEQLTWAYGLMWYWPLPITFWISFLSTWCGVNFITNTKADRWFSEYDSNLCQNPFKHSWNSFCLNRCFITGKCNCGNSTDMTSNAATAASDSVGCSNNSMSCDKINWKVYKWG